MKVFNQFVSCLVLVITLCGCQDKEASTNKSYGKLTIGVIPMSSQHDFWKSIHAGAIQASQELEVEIIWKAPIQNENLQEQVDIVESLAIRGVDGIVLAPVDQVALASPVEECVRQGIPVVIIDSALDSAEHTSFVATDNYEGGVAGAQQLAKLLDEKGDVIVLRNYEGTSSTAKRELGFLETLKNYPHIRVISSNQRCGATPESAYQKAEQLLAKFKTEDGSLKADGIFTSCEPVSFGMMRAMEDSNLVGKVVHVGFDASPALVEGLRTGHLDAIVVQDPIKMGYLGVKTLVQHLQGKKVDPRHDTGVYVVTDDNVDVPENKHLIEPDLDRWLKGS